MRPGALEVRLKDQVRCWIAPPPWSKPGGRIAYITCSVLPPENGEQIRSFVARHPEFAVVPPAQTASRAVGQGGGIRRRRRCNPPEGLLMTPRRTGTDGFFVSVLTVGQGRSRSKCLVMPGLVPGIHVLASVAPSKDVDGRDKPGHDGFSGVASPPPVA